ncbi:monovalent cation:proton antiporter-2 (CPA2) family protein [Legionella worsleiensis]|uniref:Glutathione-regulated potassium efflux system n=1 Tax=Legionella worsleiensis TaxID=45076 RepID=A0A0W1A601_9GAMM|nr:monovalent cation:proton antiporter-2 (CPA2) family protein [Legionella worsleiensis]KTD76802.1 glutathione-regulated potassium efflux system [Legionella worsleiensis]STY30645.1 monovalent cation-H antiporter-2, CPA2 family [Legionella worsleiensis]
MNQNPILNIFIFLAAASVMVPIANRFKLGSVIGYLMVGILIGPFGLKLIGNSEQIMSFGEFGVIMMLFLIGLELEPIMLWKLRKLIVGLGGLQVLITTAAITGIGIFMQYSWQASLAVGMSLALSSTALVLQMLQEKNLLKTTEGEASFAVLLFQDIAVIPILIIMPLLAQNGGAAPINLHENAFIAHLPKWQHALLVSGIIGAVILTGHYLSRHLFLIIARTNIREVFTTFSLALVVGITVLMETIGVSPALGAFIAGVVLANSQYKHTVEADIQPFKGLLLGLFFISVGMGINFTLFSDEMLLISSAVLGLVALKLSILLLLGRLFKLTKIQTIGFAIALAQGGEFAFVLFQYAGSLKVISADNRAICTLTVALSMLTTPILMLLYHRYIVPKFMSVLPEREYDTINEKNDIILAGYGRFGQIIGRFLNGENIKITVLEKNAEQIELLRKFGYKGYFGDANRLDLLKSAGAEHAKLLIVTVGNADANLKIVHMAKQHFPNLKIYARARNRRHAYELHKAGVEYFKRELFDSSLTMTKEVLKFVGYKQEDIEKKANAFQKHDEAALLKSFEFFEEEADLINFSRQASGELEQILQNS